MAQRPDKFGPVFAAIEERNYRQAMKHLEKRELASTALGKALRAMVLIRSGFREEAVGLAQEVLRTRPTDAGVVHALGEVFRNSDDLGYYIQAFDQAAADKPDDVQLGRLLCFAWLRVEDYRKLQSSALRLAKLTGKPEYYAWAALALHAQASQPQESSQSPAPHPFTGGGRGWGVAPAGPAEAPLLKMAETLLARALDVQPPAQRDSETLGLYLHTLVRQRRSAEAAAAIAPGGKYSYTPAAESAPAAPAGSSSGSSSDGAASATASGGAGATTSASGGRAAVLLSRVERAPDEDVLVSADGLEGRGRYPGPLQPVETARYSAYLRTNAAVEAEGAAAAATAAGNSSVEPLVDLWRAAGDAYATLTASFDADDWSFWEGGVYCAARGAALSVGAAVDAALAGTAGGVDAAAAAISAACAPLAAAGVAAGRLTGHAGVDAVLAPTLAAMVAAAGESATASPGGAGAASSRPPERGPCLGALLHAASRLELATRLAAVLAASPAPAAAVLAPTVSGAVEALSTQVATLLTAYVALYGHRACVFADLKPLLHMSLPAAAATAVGPSTATTTTAARLASFLSPDGRVLAMPYAPLTPPVTGSDTAAAQPLFTFSAVLPAGATAPLVAMLRRWREADRPDDDMAADVIRRVADARNAAVGGADGVPALEGATPATASAAAAPAATAAAPKTKSGGGKKKDKKKGAAASGAKKSGGSKKPAFTLDDDSDDDEEAGDGEGGAVMTPAPKTVSGSSSSGSGPVDAVDPHGVKRALSPASELAHSDESKAALAATLSRIRRYTAAVQLLRFLGGLNAPDGSNNDGAVIAELTSAWAATLPLQTLQEGGIGTSRDHGEGDEALLLAAHLLVDRGFRALTSPAAAGAPPEDQLAAIPQHALVAARHAFLEALTLLHLGLASSPYNPQLRLASARVHALLGAGAGNFQDWRALRIRHATTESLGHVAGPHLARLAWPATQRKSLDELQSFQRSSLREVPDFMLVALRDGTLSTALDLGRYRLRLRESGPVALSHSAYAHLSVLLAVNKPTADAHQHLRQLLMTGEVPEGWTDASPGALARLRANEDFVFAASWDAPSPAALAEARRGVPLAPFVPQPTSDGGVDGFASALAYLSGGGGSALFTGVFGYAGATEVALRAVARNRLIRLRWNLQAALLAVADGDAKRAIPAAEAVRALLLPSAGAAGSNALGSQLAHGLATELGSTALAVADTGISGPRPAVAAQCARIVLDALAAALAALSAATASSSAPPPGGEATAESGPSAALKTAREKLLAVGAGFDAAAAAIADNARYSSGDAAGDAAGAAAGAVNPQFLAEATALVQYAGVYAAVAVSFTGKALTGLRGGSGAGGGGKGKGGKAPAVGAKSAATAVDGDLDAASLAVATAAASAAKALAALQKAAKAAATALDGGIGEPAVLAAVAGGFTPAGCASPFVAAQLGAWLANPGLTRASTTAASTAAVDAVLALASTGAGASSGAPTGAGAAYVMAGASAWGGLAVASVGKALESVGASFTGTLTALGDEMTDLAAAFRSLAAAGGSK